MIVNRPFRQGALVQALGRQPLPPWAAEIDSASWAQILLKFIVAHPDYFFEQPPEHGLINPDNLLILMSHLKCAAFELPFVEGDDPLFGTAETGTVLGALAILEEDGVIQRVGDAWHWTDQAYPAEEISLRTAARDNVVIIDEGERAQPRVIGEVDAFSAPIFPSTA